MATTPRGIEAGKVCVPRVAGSLADYADSVASVPNANHDDDVHSTTQALNYLIGRGIGGMGIFELYRHKAEKVMGAISTASHPVDPDVDQNVTMPSRS